MGQDKVRVGIRIRPLNTREKSLLSEGNSSLITQVPTSSKNQIILRQVPSSNSNNNGSNNNNNNNSSNTKKSFTFDYVFDLTSGQEEVFQPLGEDLLSSAFEGYNGCLFAYGQTGSGKSYTMLGSNDQRGVIPRLCDAIFKRIAEERQNEPTVFKIEVSYMEIYNEKVRDLLVGSNNKTSLKVREHSILGPYVDGLSVLAVKSAEDVATLMTEGNKSRTVAATNMNSESSRSHAVFTIVMTQTVTDIASGVSGEKVSRISLVDLAGSERAVKTGAVGERLKEGSNINKSLTTLGLVISKLADGSSSGTAARDSKNFIPYRDSVLTWLLKDNLGGNSRTIMIATVSPSQDNYEETLSTLRYADRAKRIVNNAVVNEDPNAKLIRELQAEVKQLRDLLKSHVTDLVLNEQLNQSEKLMRQLSEPWEEKLVRSEQAQQERQAALEKMGISVQQSGISVEKNRFYLVNLNADPALNELLVYYLKEDRTVVGRPDAPDGPPDIQLTGLGIENLHCELVIEPDQTLYLIPYPKAHTCVNGERLNERRKILRHGDRILWGNHHFFRLNCPVKPLPTGTTTTNLTTLSTPSNGSTPDGIFSNGDEGTYEQASAEFSMKQLIQSDPIHDAVAKLESKHKKDKEVALEKQRQEFERQFTAMMHVLSPSASIPPTVSWDAQMYFQQQQLQQQNLSTSVQIVAARNTKMSEGLKILKEYLLKANQMVREANEIAEAMKVAVKYSVTLLIPPNNLTPNRPKGALVTEPSIRVELDNHYPQIWSMEKLHNRLIDMRELYEEKATSIENCEVIVRDPLNEGPPSAFFEPDVPHVLLGIANVFLQVLFYDDVTLKYPVPVINQQGEIVGRLHVELAKVSTGALGSSKLSSSRSSSQFGKLNNSLYEEYEDEDDYEDYEQDNGPRTITVKVTVRHLAGVNSSHYVFCQYVFCDQHIVVPPTTTTSVVRFDQTKYFTLPVSDEFEDYCTDSALAIEVWGHRGGSQTLQYQSSGESGINQSNHTTNANGETNNNSVTDRWKEVTSQMKIWVEIQELNENGDYVAVDVENEGEMVNGTGGVHQLRQGLQRRLQITVETSANAGQLPIVCDEIDQVSLGAISVRSTTKQRPLDSYQEVDLSVLRERWGDALKRRRDYLDRHLQDLAQKQEKSVDEQMREKSLVNQWLALTEERNAVLVPSPDSGVPGAPPSLQFKPEVGMEEHMPVMFLDISEDILSADSSPNSPPVVTAHAAGLNSLLPKEHDAQFVALPMIRKSYGDFYSAWSDQRMSNESWALVSWDSSVHDCSQLNKPTPPGEVIYVILRIAIRLSHPVQMDCILRKRICVFVKRNRASLAERLRMRFTLRKSEDSEQDRNRKKTGVTYQIVSHLPKSSEQLETRESLANLAVSHGESYIEEYIRSISAVDSILNLDRMRQSVHLRDEQMKTRPRNTLRAQQQQGISNSSLSVGNFMRKTLSVPNISQLFLPSLPLPASSHNKGIQENGTGHPTSKANGVDAGNRFLGMGDISSSAGFPNRKVRSESLANLSGFASTPGASTVSTPTSGPQSPQQSRPSSLNLGHEVVTSPTSNVTPHGSKWTSLMTTVMEEESSGYGSQKSSEDSPTNVG